MLSYHIYFRYKIKLPLFVYFVGVEILGNTSSLMHCTGDQLKRCFVGNKLLSVLQQNKYICRRRWYMHFLIQAKISI